jgi:NAD(P)-dependent dehydrogenase (short-subunit alcohol dehydrogenase family)
MNTSIRTHEGRVALVTGAAQGVGRALTVALAERGAQVIATDLSPPYETVNKMGPTARVPTRCDTGRRLAGGVAEKPQRGRGGHRCE